jgi:hypothetical protein
LKFDSPKLPPIAQKKKRCGKKKTKAANPTHKEKIKRKQMLEILDAADEDFLSLTMQTGMNLRRILERKTGKILLRRLQIETPMRLLLLLTRSQ